MAKEKKAKDRYRIILYNETTLQEEKSYRATKNNMVALLGVAVFVIAALVFVLLVYTPLKRFLPASDDSLYSSELKESALKLDSMRTLLEERNQYFVSIRNIMNGNIDAEVKPIDTVMKKQRDDYAKIKHDSILQTLIELEEQQTLTAVIGEPGKEKYKHLTFFIPVKGVVTNDFSMEHLGIDIAAKDGEPVLATLPGTVILATWSVETGNVIQVQHENNLVSIYKHNSTLLKKVGDRVEAGEPIAIIGNSGELTSGTHLHFELWENGKPINPETYIAY